NSAPGEVWKEGTDVIATYNFPGSSPEDLPFKKGDVIKIISNTKDSNWYKGRNSQGKEGMIPAPYVQKRKEVHLQKMPWFHGRITREEAEHLLVEKNDGVFLIRDSVHFQGDFTLSIAFQGKVEHYRIIAKHNMLEVDGGECLFENLIQLVKVAMLYCLGIQNGDMSLLWFHGKIKREDSEKLLEPWTPDGLFLVRESANYPGDFTLSVCHRGKVEHYRIIYAQNKMTIDEESFFENLVQLVEHYTLDADGLCTRLIQPLQKKGDAFSAVQMDDFEAGGWVIPSRDLQEIELIGHGEFGDVYKGLYKNQFVAIKQLKDKNRAAQAFLKEASVMTNLRHPNLVQMIGIVKGDMIKLVTEFMGKGNLVEYLRSRGRSVIRKKDQIDFATDTCSAMAYLESKTLVHRDLAARNILINADNCAKVSDFGLAKYGDFNTEGGKFPIKWTAPEALRDNKFSNKSDVWSFGILLWELYSFGRVPYPRIPLQDVVVHVNGGYRMESPEGCPAEVYQIMLKAWNLDPDKRPMFKDILVELDNLRCTTV
ncbi:hypothetical protein FSP39_024518, partial [Pinctada imbricata]